jgi:hypothetical protein
MPGLQLYQSELDELALVKAAFDEGCWLVPGCHYKTPQVKELRTIEEFSRARLAERHFFILSDSFVRLPLSLTKIIKQNEPVYFISSSEGGPFLEFLGGGIFVDDATQERRIRSGFFEFSRNYWATDLSKRFQSPPELEAIFKRLAGTIKKTSIRIKPGKSVFWLGNDAKTELQRGANLVGYEAWSIAVDGDRPRPRR